MEVADGVEVAVLVIFQDKESNVLHDKQSYNITSWPAVKGVDRKRALNSLLPCQEIIETNLCKNSAEISGGFITARNIWWMKNCEKTKVSHGSIVGWYKNCPSFVATHSQLWAHIPPQIITQFKKIIPVLPHKSTSMDSIYNHEKLSRCFKPKEWAVWSVVVWWGGILYCKRNSASPTWWIQQYLAWDGPFHWCKILVAVTGKFQEVTGFTKDLYKLGAFLKGATETSLMKGGDYVYYRISERRDECHYRIHYKTPIWSFYGKPKVKKLNF